MFKNSLRVLAVAGILALAAGCSRNEGPTGPGITHPGLNPDKNGTETLGPPDITIAAGTGFVEGGVGMVGVDHGSFEVTVPEGAAIRQVLLYWAGGTTNWGGDATVTLNGTEVTGSLIGGPVLFFEANGAWFSFSSYRADVTDLDLVQSGLNTFTVGGFDFATEPLDENNGCSLVVIIDDGSTADLSLRDGMDMAYFGFEPTLDATVPQEFGFSPANEDRTAELLLMAGSVGEARPNQVVVTTSLGDQVFNDVLGSFDGLTWDSLVLPVLVPAGDESISVKLVSTDTTDPDGASLGWVAAGLAVVNAPELVEISGTVFVDADEDQAQGFSEAGIANVAVDLVGPGGVVATVLTDAAGHYLFSVPSGAYDVVIDPVGHDDAFNDDLAASFLPTTDLSVPVSGAAAGIDFGFQPAVDLIIEDLEDGDLISEGRTVRWWRKVFTRGVLEERWHRRAHGHNRCHHHGGHGWGHHENYPDAEQLHEYLAAIRELYLPEPYQFDPENELKEVLRVLLKRPRTDEQDLYRELLVTELNFVGGYGLAEQDDLLGVLISWGESVVVLLQEEDDKSADKSLAGTVTGALRVFKAINTGGGGGVDE